MKKIKLFLLSTVILNFSLLTSDFSLAQDIFDSQIEKQIWKEGEEDANKREEAKKLPADFVLVEGGSFQMGSNSGVHKVTLSSFYIGKYEVTQSEYDSIMGNNPSRFKGTNLPVEQVSFNDAVEFCNKYNKAKGLPNAYDSVGNIINFTSYRLPTEAEWEYVARGGNKSQGYTYSGSSNVDEVAWYSFNSSSKTHQVGTKKPNELGIYDMSGNVLEWCSDWHDKNYYINSPLTNPYNNESTFSRVIRGGSWFDYGDILRVGEHYGNSTPMERNYYLGFRLVRTSSEK